ncbi:MAG: IS110 family transposase [Planctomycetota bacterium]
MRPTTSGLSVKTTAVASPCYVGLDVHQLHSTMHVLDSRGNRLKRHTIKAGWPSVVREVEGLSTDESGRTRQVHVCFEASVGAGHLYDLLRARCHRVAVAHPGQLRLIFRSKQKNDRADAEKLAKLLFLDEVPSACMPTKSVRNWRRLIETRRRTVEKRSRVKNSLCALLRSRGTQVPEGTGLWTKKGLRWLTEQDFDDSEALQRDLWLDELELLTKQIARMERELDRIGSASPPVALLQAIHGIGPRTSEAVAAYIDNPDRFRNAKAVGAYFGLVSGQDQSGSTNRLGHITKEWPATVRKLLTEATWHPIRLSPNVKAIFDRIHRGDRERRKIALIAASHALVRAMHATLRDNQPWCERDLPGTAPA